MKSSRSSCLYLHFVAFEGHETIKTHVNFNCSQDKLELGLQQQKRHTTKLIAGFKMFQRLFLMFDFIRGCYER